MRQKSAENSSEGDNTFDFNFKQYKIDISDRKGKTGQTFKQESGLDFDDFKDLDNKTQKSQIYSQKKWLPSDLVKKSEESLIITQNPTEMSIKKRGGSFMADNYFLKGENSQGEANFASYGASPKFNDNKIYQTVTHGMFSKAGKSQLSVSDKSKLTSKLSIQAGPSYNRGHQQVKSPQKMASPKFNNQGMSYNVSSSRQKPPPMTTRLTPEAEYQDILNSIQYYQNCNEKLEYQSIKLMEEIGKYQRLLEENPADDFEMEKLADETYLINTEISNQRSLQRTLIDQKSKLQEEFDQIAYSIQCMHFQRPTLLKDETKAVIDEINSLKAQFQALKRDEGSLNFSTTIVNPNATSIQNRTLAPIVPPSTKSFNPQQTLMSQYLSQILACSASQPNYIHNIKMLAIKDEWKLYEDTEICVSCSTRDYPMTEIRVGNKSVRNLGDFGLREGGAVVAEREVLQAKNYFIHGMRVGKVSQPFLKIELQYKPNSINPQSIPLGSPPQLKKLVFFIPTLPLKQGQFIPITPKEYQKQVQQHRNLLEQHCSLQKPIDTQIIHQNLQQIFLYFPNLLYQKNQQTGEETCVGIFRLWNSSEGALVRIRKKENRLSIYVKNNISFLLQSLEFLLAVVV